MGLGPEQPSPSSAEKKEIVVIRIDVCPECGSEENTWEVKDVAFSIHYVDDRREYTCLKCGNTWLGESVGYKGVA